MVDAADRVGRRAEFGSASAGSVASSKSCRASLCAFASTLAFAASLPAAAQNNSSRPLKIVVGFTAGGGTDVAARTLAQRLSVELKRPVVVENRPGAGGTIGTDFVAKAAPDGHTILMLAAADAVQAGMRSDLPYDLLRDFAPVTLAVKVPFALTVHPSVPASSVADLVKLAKSSPGKLTHGSAGTGSSPHLAAELFKSAAGIDALHVPFRGVVEAASALAGGHIDFQFSSFPAVVPLIHAKRLRVLATTGATRAKQLLEVPTVAEAGIEGYRSGSWYGLAAPVATPSEVINALYAASARVLEHEPTRDRLIAQGFEPVAQSPAEFRIYIRDEMAQTARLLRSIKASTAVSAAR